MAIVVSVHEAKPQLSKIIDQAAAGHDVIIAKAGRRVVRPVPLKAGPQPKKLGGLAGKLWVPDNFNRPLDERVIAAFESRS